ncbi:spore germination protein [Metabacillus halosaccharovorans]|uniref:spore germination protein n=1 Tax=Metabacillus halosaccharovorans TaxID=930124 RepID=UPI00373577E3
MFKKFRFHRKKNKPTYTNSQNKHVLENNEKFEVNIDRNISKVKELLETNDDIVFREIVVFIEKPVKVLICYFSTLSSNEYINEFVVKPLQELNMNNNQMIYSEKSNIEIVKNNVLDVGSLSEHSAIDAVVNQILSGKAALFIDGSDTALIIEAQGFAMRNVSEPDTESVVRGPREGFTENIEVNTGLIRRKIVNSKLYFEKFTIGKQTHTKIRIAYIEGIVNKKVVQEVKARLKKIDIDSILESGYIEQLIEDHPTSIFPTVGNSEKPDIIAARLLEGKVAILCDGTPFVLSVPYMFVENFQISEDYYSRPYFASAIRLLRLLALFLTVTIPAFYVALTSYHHAMIPTVLLTSMAAAEETVPFPVLIETLLIGTAFEILREAGVRLPRPVGSAISIVGALIIGEGAVQAGLVSAPMVIAMALTGISSFIVPAINDAVVLSRLFFVLLAGILGLYGVLIGFLIILAHMCSLRSFGTPYLAPHAPIILREWKDTLIRAPLWKMNQRPQSITWEHETNRQGTNQKPKASTRENGSEEK